MPSEAPICFYRVAQEALRNVQKHSGSTDAELELKANHDAVSLVVTDFGSGFAPGSVPQSRGLGMASMAERVRGLGGHFLVESLPGWGTRLVASIPLHADASDASDASGVRAGAAEVTGRFTQEQRVVKRPA
jgi:signal transduction histidine kinase